jgi:putative ABC transport system permease protein
MNTAALVETTLRELRRALRMLRLNPAFSLTVILTLALGIGATTAIFSVVNGVVIKPLAYPDADEVVTVGQSALFGGVRGNNFPSSPQHLEVYLAEGRAFEEIGLVRGGAAAVTGSGDPEQATTLLVSAGAMRALGVRPALGRELSSDDDQPGAALTTIISDRYWQRRFGGDPSVIGRTITVDGTQREVIGVMPAGFNYRGNPADLILPLQINFAQPRADFNFAVVARLKPGVTVADANADLGRMLPIYIEKYMRPVAAAMPDALQLQPAVRPLKEDVVGNIGQVLWVLLGSISILLLIACANVANLLLVRTEARGTELAVRTALGAGTGHLARGLMTESLTLGVVGGLVGVALAYGALQILTAIAPANLPRLNEITIDLPVLGFAVAMSILSGLLFGLFPVLRLAGRRFAGNLMEFVHGGGRGASTGKKQQRSQNALVVVQVALALVMLVSAGLMIRTFQNLRSVEPGFNDPATIQTLRVTMPNATAASDPERVPQLQARIRESLAAIPGVTSVAYTSVLPMDGGGGVVVFAEDKTYAANEFPPSRTIKRVSPGLFQTLGTPLLAGRDFDWQEIENQRNVAVVSENFARETWNTVEGALGKRVRIGTDGPFQDVIGVVADVYDDGAHQPAPAIVYWPARQHRGSSWGGVQLSIVFALRTDRAGTESLLQEIRRAVSAVTPDLPFSQARTLAEVQQASMARTSFSLVLLGIAGAMALLLSIVGVYGVLAYAVTQRQREVGIRMALGAAPRAVQRMFVYRGMVLSAAGIGVGAVAAVLSTRLLSSLLFGVEPFDAVTFVAAAVFLALAALLASYIPARRAAAVPASESLRG